MSNSRWRPLGNFRKSKNLLISVNKILQEKNIEIRIPFFLMFSDLILRSKKESFTLNWIFENLSKGETFLDIGANIGEFGLISKKITGATGTLIALEPRSKTFRQLRKVLRANDVVTNIFLYKFAASSINASSFLRQKRGKSSSYGKSRVVTKIEMEKKYKRRIKYQATKLMKIDDLIRSEKLPYPNLIKIDVEGHELQVIQGMCDTLLQNEVRSVLIETNIENIEEIRKFMFQCNFLNFNWLRIPGNKSPGYALFEREIM